jgi:hypothetical protein
MIFSQHVCPVGAYVYFSYFYGRNKIIRGRVSLVCRLYNYAKLTARVI